MRKLSLAVSFLLILFSQVQASTHWGDIQRQATEINLQQLESASLSLQVLSENSAALRPKGTVVIFPDQQQHALSPGLLNTLRINLPDSGWHLFVMPAPEALAQANAEQRLLQQKSQLAARWQLLNQQGNLQAPVIVIAQGETAALINLLVAETLEPARLMINAKQVCSSLKSAVRSVWAWN
ncbi:DUF3530 family protein [Alishewanella longhuensis]